jgi:hypothetical protein
MTRNIATLILAGLTIWLAAVVIEMRREDWHEQHRPGIVMLLRN